MKHISDAIAELNVELVNPVASTHQQPPAPDALVLDFLHRSHDGVLSLERKVDGNWQTLGNVKAAYVGGLFSNEVIADACNADSYFSLHGMFASGHHRQRTNLPGLEPFRRNLKSVRWLTCFHVDLDAYKFQVDSHAAIAAVMRLVDAGTLPPPSLFTTSRGAWCIWLLVDQENRRSALRSYSTDGSTVERWSKIQNALHKACATIGSDPATKHAASVTRIPGSINTKNNARVSFSFHVNAYTGKPYQYTLPEMESLVLCHQQPARIASTRIVDAETRKAKQRGWHGRWNRVLELLRCLRDMRGGWKVGCRSSAIFYAGTAIKALHSSPAEARRELMEHVATMEQPIGDEVTIQHAQQICHKLKVQKHGGASHQTISDSLDVTPQEAALLSSNRRTPFPSASRFETVAPLRMSLASRTSDRRTAIHGICESCKDAGWQITGALVQQHLDALGLHAALATVLNDMKYVGYPSQRTHRETSNERTKPERSE